MADGKLTEKKATQLDTLKKVLNYIRRYWVMVGVSLLLAAVTVVLTLYVPILTGDAVDLLLGKGAVDFPAVFAIMRKIAVAVVVTAAAQWVMNTCNNHITYRVVKDIREAAFERLEELPLKYLDAHAYGDIVSRVIADVDTFADGLLMGFTQLFTGVLTILGTLCFMLITNVPIALVVICITPVSFLVAKFIATKTYVMFKQQSETRGEQTTLIEEMVGNQKIVKTFSREKTRDLFLVHHESRDALCQQPCVCGRRYFRRFRCDQRRHQRRTAVLLFKLCEPVYEAV